MGSLADPPPINAVEESMGRIVFLLLALFGEREGTYAAERGAAAGASAASSPAPLRKSSTRDNFHGGGHSLGRIATKTAIPKTSLRRYLTDVHR